MSRTRTTAPGARTGVRVPGARQRGGGTRQRGTGARLRGERGAVTAETVMVLPLLVAVAIGLAWLLALVATQVRVVDAAREVARASARDDSTAHALALGRRVAPAGAVIALQQSGGDVVATVRTRVRGPGGLLSFLPGVEVQSRAVAAKEPS